MTATLFTHPIDVVKVHAQLSGELLSKNDIKGTMQTRNTKNPLAMIHSASKGHNGLYRGISASLLRQSIFATTRHGLYYHLNQHFAKISPLASLASVSSAMLAGIIGAVAANPADVVLIRMQSDSHWPPQRQRRYRHVFDGILKIIRKESWRRLWRGCLPTVIRAVLVTSSQIPSYHLVKGLLVSKWSEICHSSSVSTHILAGSASAICASLATNPVDLIKTRIINMQKTPTTTTHTGSTSINRYYSSPLDCAARTVKAEGLLGLYKGIYATMARLVPHTMILWVVQEQVISFFDREDDVVISSSNN